MSGEADAGTEAGQPTRDRFADLVRLRLSRSRVLRLDEEKELLSAAVCDIGLDLETARGILLWRAAEQGVLLESVERQRVAKALQAAGKGRPVTTRQLRDAAALAQPLAIADGRSGVDAQGVTRAIAQDAGLAPEWRWWWLGPRRWYETAPGFADQPATATAPWWAVR